MATPRAFVRLRSLITPTRSHLAAAGGSSCWRSVIPAQRPAIYAHQKRWQSGQTGGPAAGGANDYQFGPASDVQPQPGTQHLASGPKGRGNSCLEEIGGDGKPEEGGDSGRGSGTHAGCSGTVWKMFESAATTAASLSILGLAGYGYHKYYKHLVLKKIDNAFNEGDPALNLASASRDDPKAPWYDFFNNSSATEGTHSMCFVPIQLEQQDKIDRIINGQEQGHYYLLIGEKGTGKTSMLLTAMHRTGGEMCSVMEAHGDPEIFRLRLGKALDFEFHEDYIGSLFSIRGPRETTALLDIERAFNKLEKVALARRKEYGKPLVMIINGMHMVHDDEVGRDLLELLQQRAEGWAAAGLVTVVFNSDDYWVYERMKQYGSRMELISVRDLTKPKAIEALKVLRNRRFPQSAKDEEDFNTVYDKVGGRLAFLTKVAKEKDMIKKCDEICEDEKTWLLNKCWILGEEMDDDVMDQQKFAYSAMLLVKALVDLEKKLDAEDYDPGIGHRLPELPLHAARQIMTRADFIQQYDHDNIFTIDSKARVRADSVPMMNAFRQICAEEGFAEYLEETMSRIGDIESLGRTREVTLKDLWNGGKLKFQVQDSKGRTDKTVVFDVERGHKGIHGDDGDGDEDGEDDR